jgi:hypothetical protein
MPTDLIAELAGARDRVTADLKRHLYYSAFAQVGPLLELQHAVMVDQANRIADLERRLADIETLANLAAWRQVSDAGMTSADFKGGPL